MIFYYRIGKGDPDFILQYNTTIDLVRRHQVERRRITMSGRLKTIKPEVFNNSV